MKYKVLAADDEYFAREKIRKLIDWEAYGMEFLEPAEDGEEVLKKIEEFQPDILITDINMPYLNGVELLKRLKEMKPDLVTFVVSGYDDFSYVKDSFMSGSINYLLKPVKKEELEAALKEARRILESREEEKGQEQQNREEHKKALSVIYDREFSRLLEKKTAHTAKELSLPEPVNIAEAALILVKIHNLSRLSKENDYDMNQLSYHVKTWLKEQLQQERLLVFHYVYHSNEFIILTEASEQEMKKMAETICREFPTLSLSPVTVAVGEKAYDLDTLYPAYVQAISLLMERTYVMESQIICFDSEQKNRPSKIKSRMDEILVKELKKRLSNNEREQVKELIFRRIGLAACTDEQWDYLEVKQTVRKILNSITACSDGKMTVRENIDLENMMDSADKVMDTLNVSQLCEIVEDIIDYVMQIQQEEVTDSIRDMVRQAVNYINDNYFEDLTLSSVAGRFHVENSYFSRLFRKETGESLILYITRLRIDKAKEYIQHTDTNLAEIAFMVGYDDYTYFNKVFKKITGMSPREYKNECFQKKTTIF